MAVSIKDNINTFTVYKNCSNRMFYVYAHKRLDTNEVFYIGVGTSVKENDYSRALETKKRSTFWKDVAKKGLYDIDIIEHFQTREEALKREVQLVAIFGRRDKKIGSLVNLTDGGEGVSGTTHTVSLEVRQKIAEANRKRVWSEESKKKMSESLSKKERNKGKDNKTCKLVLKICPITNNILEEFFSRKEAARCLGVSPQSIGDSIYKETICKNFKFKYGSKTKS